MGFPYPSPPKMPVQRPDGYNSVFNISLGINSQGMVLKSHWLKDSIGFLDGNYVALGKVKEYSVAYQGRDP